MFPSYIQTFLLFLGMKVFRSEFDTKNWTQQLSKNYGKSKFCHDLFQINMDFKWSLLTFYVFFIIWFNILWQIYQVKKRLLKKIDLQPICQFIFEKKMKIIQTFLIRAGGPPGCEWICWTESNGVPESETRNRKRLIPEMWRGVRGSA